MTLKKNIRIIYLKIVFTSDSSVPRSIPIDAKNSESREQPNVSSLSSSSLRW